jgi:hypothetical protein
MRSIRGIWGLGWVEKTFRPLSPRLISRRISTATRIYQPYVIPTLRTAADANANADDATARALGDDFRKSVRDRTVRREISLSILASQRFDNAATRRVLFV